jgi:hypothetical protein
VQLELQDPPGLAFTVPSAVPVSLMVTVSFGLAGGLVVVVVDRWVDGGRVLRVVADAPPPPPDLEVTLPGPEVGGTVPPEPVVVVSARVVTDAVVLDAPTPEGGVVAVESATALPFRSPAQPATSSGVNATAPKSATTPSLRG